MAGKVHDHNERRPRSRLAERPVVASFFPGEVARILRLTDIDYSQLRRIYRLSRRVRGQPPPPRGWARFTLTDLAATEIIVNLLGGRDALAAGRRLVFGDLEAACQSLNHLGFEDPLLQVPMAREGRRILARVGTHVIEPTTGQLALTGTSGMVDDFLRTRLITDRSIRAALRAEYRRVQPASRSRQVKSGIAEFSEILVG